MLLMCHANAEDIGMSDPKQLAEDFNSNICLFDYAGYGMHTCKESSEEACQRDVLAVYHHLLSLSINDIVIYGRSIGTGVACYLAYYLSLQHKPCRLILVSAFKSVCKTMFNLWIPWDILINEDIASQITASTLFIHGCRDDVTPYFACKELSLLFPNVYDFVSIRGATHHYIYLCHLYKQAMINFIHL